jgi:LDH2 family malate/lactate/ureidoglycolate dehydrogenase
LLKNHQDVAPGTFQTEVDDLVKYLKSSPTVPGVGEILTPGEPEMRIEIERRNTGALSRIRPGVKSGKSSRN